MAGGAMDKSPDAFRTISEVAEDLDLPQHVLRFWETRFNHIKPLKRGGGRRYYRPDDVDLLKGIRHLLYGEGYTIKGVQRILKEEGVRFVQAVGRGEESVAAPRNDARDPPQDDDEDQAVPLDEEVESHQPAHAFSGDALQKLQGALEDLIECDRVLRSLKAPSEPVSAE
jgi:DNA-binding transcriptional MerR regulator